jgi:hypothetical protein
MDIEGTPIKGWRGTSCRTTYQIKLMVIWCLLNNPADTGENVALAEERYKEP